MLEIDIPEVLAELVAAFEGYERALVDNDIARLNALFWDSPLTLRYGTRVSEIQCGHEEIAAFRISRGIIDQRRLLRNRRVTTFGRDFGVANTEFIPADFRTNRSAKPDLDAHGKRLEDSQRTCLLRRVSRSARRSWKPTLIAWSFHI